MRKTKKSNIKKVVATAPACVCPRAHRVWSIVALLGLFLCGLMIGLPIGAKHAPRPTEKTLAETVIVENVPTCVRIEKVLSDNLRDPDVYSPKESVYLDNANVYASMVEYGCPENAEKYRAEALANLAIADALYNGLAKETSNTYSVIDTYKKLEMQKQAHEFLNKVQKLTDPAIDFIMQMEKIINE